MKGFAARLLADVYEALRFLTPWPLPGSPVTRGPGAIAGAFPLAGLVLGSVLALLDLIVRWSGLTGLACDALVVIALVVLTGGLHLDGLMDTCDGLAGGRSPAARLEIMKDSRVGAFGVLGCVCVVLLKVGLLGALTGTERPTALLLMPLLGRWAIVLGAAVFPPARASGLGATFHAGITVSGVVIAFVSTFLVCALLAGADGLVTLLVCCAGSYTLGACIRSAVGGLTGDSYGALVEVQETLVLLVFAVLQA